jgi:hypothetical protein
MRLAQNQFDAAEPNSPTEGIRSGRSSATKPPIPPRSFVRPTSPRSPHSETGSIRASIAPPSARPRSQAFSVRTGTSGRSIPFSAIVSPRPPDTGFSMGEYSMGFSDGREEGVFMRHPNPRRGGWGKVGWKVRFRPPKQKGTEKLVSEFLDDGEVTPLPGRLFYPAFIFPFLWMVASLLREPHLHRVSETEAKWDQREWEQSRIQVRSMFPPIIADLALTLALIVVFKTWRTRCRVMALVSLVTYLPIIVLLAIFVPR